MASIEKVSRVLKLNSNNYEIWKVRMEMYLIHEKLQSIVCERKTRAEGETNGKPTKAQLEFDEEAE